MAGTLTDRLRNVEQRLRAWRPIAVKYRDEVGAGISADRARELLADVRHAISILNQVPRTQATADKAIEEWNYSDPTNIGTHFNNVVTALQSVGDRVAAGDNQLWNGYAIAPTYPWSETIPKNTDATLQSNIQAVIDAIDVFIGNIPEPSP